MIAASVIMTPVIRTQISMTEDQAEGLRRLATLRRRSQAALLRDALDALLHDEDLGRRLARARQGFGAFRSGADNLAEDHDRVFAESIDP